MARVVVDVMPKPEILDPQGKAVLGALPRLGFEGVTEVRQGKRFELEIEGDLTEARLAEVEKMAETLLSNPVIEDYAVRLLSIRSRWSRHTNLRWSLRIRAPGSRWDSQRIWKPLQMPSTGIPLLAASTTSVITGAKREMAPHRR